MGHQCMVMEGFFAELGSAVVNNFESFREDVVNALPFLNSTMSFAADQVRKMMLVAEELHGEDRDDAVRDTDGYCTENSRFYSMSRHLTAQYNECLHGDEEEFMMPLNYSGPAGAPGDSNPHGHHHNNEHDGPPPQPRVNMGLYTFCIEYVILPANVE